MKDLLARLSSMSGVSLNPPADPKHIEAAELNLGAPLPAELREFYLLCDGLVLDEGNEVPSLQQSQEYFSQIPGSLTSTWLVVLDEHESNPICLFHQGPLRGYVAHVYHDGDSHVRWRSFRGLLEHVLTQLSRDGEMWVRDLRAELDHPKRTERDIEAGRAMIQFASSLELHSAESPLAYTFAFDLLGDEQVAEIAAFLEHEDMFVARAARDRLVQLPGDEAKAALKKHQDELKRLVERCAEVFRRAGREVTVVNDCDFRVGPNQMGLNWEAIYTQKQKPDFDQWLLRIGGNTSA
jgi:hypothetical protein